MKDKKTTLNRREFVRLNTAAFAGTLFAPAIATGKESQSKTAEGPEIEPLGFYRFDLGDLQITVINDGFFHLSEITPPDIRPIEALAYNTTEYRRQEFFGSHLLYSDDPRIHISPIIIESCDRTVLVDSGWSMPGASDTAGRLGSSLEMLGISRESIDTVVVTHAHPDHVGLADPDTGVPIYPNAEVVISEDELAFWTSDAAAPLLDNPVFQWIPNVFEALDGQFRIIKAGDEILTGIRSIPSPGHTPGHISLGIEAGGRELLLTGDAIVNTHTVFERPDWHNFFDLDREQAGRTRRKLLDRAATDEMLILGYHLPFPGIGYALRYGDVYRWHAAGATLLP